MGEVVRLILLQLTVDNEMFGGQVPEALQEIDGFPAKYVNEILK